MVRTKGTSPVSIIASKKRKLAPSEYDASAPVNIHYSLWLFCVALLRQSGSLCTMSGVPDAVGGVRSRRAAFSRERYNEMQIQVQPEISALHLVATVNLLFPHAKKPKLAPIYIPTRSIFYHDR